MSFGSRGAAATTPTRYNAIQLLRSTYGQPVPLIYGQCRVPPVLIWYSDFVSTPHSQNSGGKGGGGQTSTSYSYTAALMLLLGEGTLPSGPVQVYDGASTKTLAQLNLTQVALGSIGQAVWSYLTTNHPTQAIPYSDLAYIASPLFALGSSAGMSNLNVEQPGLQQYGGGVVDAEPSAMLVDYMTDPRHGANFLYLASLTGANSFQQWCIANGMFLSYNENTQRPAADLLKEIMRITTSGAVLDGSGFLHLVPFGDQAVSGNGGSWTPNLTPQFSFTDDDYVQQSGQDPVNLVRTPYTQTFNVVPIEYEDRANNYNTAIATAFDDNDVALNGTRPMTSQSLHAIKSATLAKLVAQLILQRQLYYRNQYRLRLRPDYCGLEPMDFVALTDSAIGLNNTLCRVLEVTDYAKDDGLEILVEEVPIGPATAPLYNWQAIQGYSANQAVAPGSVNAPYIFMVPAGLSTDGQARIGIAVNGPSNGVWAGCNVWVSFDGTNYEQLGSVTNPARYGTLTSSFATGADPDTVNTLSVTLNRTDLTLAGGVQADADQMRTLCMVDGELVSYQAATFVSAGKYNLGTYLRRGCYGSTIGAHAANAKWARLDQSIPTLPLDAGMIGQAISFKFTSFNIFMQGTETLASVPAYTYTPSAGQTAGVGEAWKCTGSAVAQAGRLFKAPGTGGAWDSNATGKALNGACWVQGRVMDATSLHMIGFTTAPGTVNYAGGNFALYANAGTLYVYESGTNVSGGLGSYAPGDVFAARVDGKGTYYYRNGTLVWTSRKPIPATTPLYPVGYLESSTGGFFDVAYGVGPTTQLQQSGANLLSNLSWLPGTTGNQGLFADVNGGTAGAIVLGDGSSATLPFGPYGVSDILWQARGSAAAGLWGGYENPSGNNQAAPYLSGDIVGLDPTKSYRYSCWFRYHGPTTGTPYAYFGLDTGGITLDIAAGSPADANPYFAYCACSNLMPDKWYLAVGILHGSGNVNTAHSGVSGIYDPANGQRVAAANGYAATANVPFGADFQQKVGVCGQSIRSFFNSSAGGGSTAFYGWFAKPRFEEMNGNEPSIWSLLHPTSTVDPSTGLLLALGSVPPIIPSVGFSWTTTSGQVTITWPAFSLYRPDGSVTNISAGAGTTVTGLTNSTVYTVYPFVAEGATTVSFATGYAGSAGTPAMCYAGGSPQGAQGAYLFGNVPLNSFTVTPSSSGGGGGGDRLGCMHPATLVELAGGKTVFAGELRTGWLEGPERPVRITSLHRAERGEWAQVYFRDQPGIVTVTLDHRFIQPDGELVRTGDLRLGTIVAGRGGRNLVVESLALLHEKADMVSIGVEGQSYYLGGALSHNGNPKP